MDIKYCLSVSRRGLLEYLELSGIPFIIVHIYYIRIINLFHINPFDSLNGKLRFRNSDCENVSDMYSGIDIFQLIGIKRHQSLHRDIHRHGYSRKGISGFDLVFPGSLLLLGDIFNGCLQIRNSGGRKISLADLHIFNEVHGKYAKFVVFEILIFLLCGVRHSPVFYKLGNARLRKFEFFFLLHLFPRIGIYDLGGDNTEIPVSRF